MSTEPNDPGDPPPSGNTAAPPPAAPNGAAPTAAAPATQRAPERQSAAGLAVIGGLGVIAVVVSALIWVIAGHITPPGGSATAAATPELLEIEQLLDRLSFPPGKVDGVFDQDTAKAIGAYQQAAGLTVDSQPSAALLNELRDVAGPATP